jgi:hypothetical protein
MLVSDDMHELEQGKRAQTEGRSGLESDLLCHQQFGYCEAIVASAASGNKTMLQYDDVERRLALRGLAGERGMTERGWVGGFP